MRTELDVYNSRRVMYFTFLGFVAPGFASLRSLYQTLNLLMESEIVSRSTVAWLIQILYISHRTLPLSAADTTALCPMLEGYKKLSRNHVQSEKEIHPQLGECTNPCSTYK